MLIKACSSYAVKFTDMDSPITYYPSVFSDPQFLDEEALSTSPTSLLTSSEGLSTTTSVHPPGRHPFELGMFLLVTSGHVLAIRLGVLTPKDWSVVSNCCKTSVCNAGDYGLPLQFSLHNLLKALELNYEVLGLHERPRIFFSSILSVFSRRSLTSYRDSKQL